MCCYQITLGNFSSPNLTFQLDSTKYEVEAFENCFLRGGL